MAVAVMAAMTIAVIEIGNRAVVAVAVAVVVTVAAVMR
jgi:hypothetical protein